MKNWKTTFSGTGAAICAGLAALAAAPAQLGDVSTILPEKTKSYIFATGLISAFLLRIIKAAVSADATGAAGSLQGSTQNETQTQTQTKTKP